MRTHAYFRNRSSGLIRLLWLLLLAPIASELPAQEISDAEKKWLAAQILDPEATVLAFINLSARDLDLDRVPEPNPSLSLPETVAELDQLIEKEPLNSLAAEKRFGILENQGKIHEGFTGLQKVLDALLETLEEHPDSFDLVNKANGIFLLARDAEKANQLTEMFLSENPRHAEAKAVHAMHLAVLGQYEKSRNLIDEAYANDPKLNEVYQAEWSYQWTQSLNKLGQGQAVEIDEGMGFFEKASQAHPKLIAPKLCLHTLSLSRAFILSLIDNQEKFTTEEPFQIEVKDKIRARVERDEKFFRKALKNNYKNPYLLYKSLVTALVLTNEIKASEKIYEASQKVPHYDLDVYRIMVIGAISQANFTKAASYLADSYAVSENPDNRKLEARLLHSSGMTEKAIASLRASKVGNRPRLKLALVSYLIKLQKWAEAQKEFDTLSGGYEDPVREATYRYLHGILSLASGDQSTAKMYLYLLKKDERYGESAEKIMDFFELE